MNPYDQIAADYDQLYDEPLSQAEDDIFVARWLHPEVERALDLDAPIVDVGCGTGWLLDKKNVPPSLYLGFDLSEGMVAQARRKHPVWDFTVADMRTDWPSPYGEAGLVACLWASPNYDDELEQMQLAAKALRPGGRILYLAHAIGAVADGRIHKAGSYVPVDCYTDSWRPWIAARAARAAQQAGLTDIAVTPFRPIGAPRIPLPRAIHRARIRRQPRDENRAVFLAVTATLPHPA